MKTWAAVSILKALRGSCADMSTLGLDELPGGAMVTGAQDKGGM